MIFQRKLKMLINHDEIAEAVKRLSHEIEGDYQDKSPLLIGVLKGSFMFMADLIREINLPLELDFIRLASYDAGMVSSGRVEIIHETSTPVTDRHVLVVEDIVDTGVTISFLLNCLKNQQPASLKVCTLTDKPSRRMVTVPIDYCGFTVPNKFIVGYGLDCAQRFRNLPDIYILED